MSKELTIKIKIEGKEVELTSKQLELFKKNADNLKKSLDELGERTEENAEQFDKLKGDLESLESVFGETKDSINDNTDALENTEKQTVSYAAEIRKLRNELAGLGDRTEENASEYDRLSNRIIELKNAQEDLNFGTLELKDSLAGLPGPLGLVGKGIQTFDNVTKSARSAVVSLTKTFPILKSAIAATGIGALVIIIGTLVAAVIRAFKTFEPLQEAVGKLGTLMDVLGDSIQPVIDLIGRGLTFALEGLARILAFVTGQTEKFNAELAKNDVIKKYSKDIRELELSLKLYGDLNTELQNEQIRLAKEYQEELKKLAESEIETEEEKLNIKKGLLERYLRDVKRAQEKANLEETAALKKITDERLKIERDFQDKLESLRNQNRILRAKTEVEQSLLNLKFQEEQERKEILQSQFSQQRKNQLLLELEEKYQLQRQKITENAEIKIQDFLRSILKLGFELTSDVLDNQTKVVEIEYRKQREEIEKSFEEIINLYELYNEDTTNIVEIQTETLKLLEQRKNRDLLRLNEDYILNRMQNESLLFEESMNNSEVLRMQIESDILDISNAYMKATTFADVFFGGFKKRMSEMMEMEFEKLQDIREIYKAQFKSYDNFLELEKLALKAQLDDKLISQIEYETRLSEIQRESAQNYSNYIQRLVQFDQLRLDAFRELKNEEMRIAENANQVLQNILGDSIKAQTAGALADATLAIARIITDTQRAIIAFTASVAPLGPAGIPIAGAYALRAKLSAGFGIAAITTGAIAKIKGLKSQTQSSTSGGQSNNLGRGYADGGLVLGAGTSRSDSIPANLSNGEFVMNASSTSMFLPMLEMLNNAGRQTSVPTLRTTLSDSPQDTNKSSEMIIKSYVVESDLTSMQHQQSRLKNLSTL